MEINSQFNLKYKIGDLVWVVRNGETPNRNATWVNQCMIVEIICERPTMGDNDELWFDDVFYGVVSSLDVPRSEVMFYSDTSVFDSLEQMFAIFKKDEGDNLFLFPPEPLLKKPI